MRYYRIEIFEKAGLGNAFIFESHPQGQLDPGALNIEVDALVAAQATPEGQSAGFLRIYGISIKDIAQSRDFNELGIKVFGGMRKGLPLANPAQSGLLMQGTINQAFGNWIGTEMTLDFIVVADGGSIADPNNIVLNWKKGTLLAAALFSTLTTAFPKFKVNIIISPDLVLQEDDNSFYRTIGELATYVESVSRSIIKADTYPGVSIVMHGDRIDVMDFTNGEAGIDTVTVTADKPKSIDFIDLIGQPTWIGPQEIQVTCVLRGDLNVGDSVILPKSQTTTLPQSLSQYRDRSVFQGTFQVIRQHHIGNYRQPDGESWVTTIDCVPAAEANTQTAA